MRKLYVQRLNMDNTWVVKIGETSVLIDPWLHGEEVDYFKWFNAQRHKTRPLSYDSVPDYDIVLITQKYPDHFHKETLLKLKPKKLIVPGSIYKAVCKLLPKSEVLKFDLSLKNVCKKFDHFYRKPCYGYVDIRFGGYLHAWIIQG